MERQKVFALINQERAYQDKRWADENDSVKDIATWFTYISRYVDLGMHPSVDADSYRMEQLRKIAALAVAAMEHNETPAREL